MAVAKWNGAIIADSHKYERVEGNIYFPLSSVNQDYLKPSNHTSHCPWKGDASYYTLIVDGAENVDAAWVYSEPYEKAAHIKDHISFWKDVIVVE